MLVGFAFAEASFPSEMLELRNGSRVSNEVASSTHNYTCVQACYITYIWQELQFPIRKPRREHPDLALTKCESPSSQTTLPWLRLSLHLSKQLKAFWCPLGWFVREVSQGDSVRGSGQLGIPPRPMLQSRFPKGRFLTHLIVCLVLFIWERYIFPNFLGRFTKERVIQSTCQSQISLRQF